ncbi:YczE/YyaS/YitT family protein [Sporosarcina sp. CAU 1771]
MKAKLIVGIFYLVGLLLLALGVSMMIIADLGVGPWDAVYVALSEKLGLTVGSWVFIVGILLIIVNSLLAKGIPDFLAIITIIIIGSFVDFWLLIVFAEYQTGSFGKDVIVMSAGVLVLAIGIASYLQMKVARNPIDNLMVVIQQLTGKSIAFTKTAMELVVLVIAFFIGGPIGIGTIIITIIIGPLIQLFYPRFTKLKVRLCDEVLAEG